MIDIWGFPISIGIPGRSLDVFMENPKTTWMMQGDAHVILGNLHIKLPSGYLT